MHYWRFCTSYVFSEGLDLQYSFSELAFDRYGFLLSNVTISKSSAHKNHKEGAAIAGGDVTVNFVYSNRVV